MLRNVFLKTLRDRRRSMVWWAVGIVFLALTTVGFWPTIEESGEELNRLVEDLPAALRAFAGGELDLTSPEGYLAGRLFSFLGPLLFLVFTIGFGSRTIAGEEREGTLELVLARPIARWRIVAEKLAALAVSAGVLGVVLWASLAALAVPVGLPVSAGRLGGATLMLVLIALTFGALALLIGALTGRRGTALGITVAVAFVMYLVDAYAPVSEPIERIQGLSPFYYYDAAEPLRNGVDPAHAAFLVVLAVFLAAFALLAFDRRDVGV